MVDLERCIGCKSCETSCKLENGIPEGRYRTKVAWINPQGGRRLDFMAMPCMHCEMPACISSCPVSPKAIYKRKEDGIVLIDKKRCDGCQCTVFMLAHMAL
jgi:Fe-S-cluster-containing dehydrogenase component